ncbi:uncharacterized protein LOC135691023 isoform X3 [Rhopilema esculentum]|uniref:uncharacterized protein LOC135691023 isoform X3 n=1 Tax=Rhopilema esculentum TaxID=499914 RepID=UPI0031DB1C57
MASKEGIFGNDFNFDEASQTNISEISFPSHVSGLESFAEFDRTFSEFQDEHLQTTHKESENGNDSENMSYFRLSLPNVAEANSQNSDSSGEGLLHTPSTGRQQIVMKFLTEDRIQRHLPNPSNEDKTEGNLMEFSSKVDKEFQGEQKRSGMDREPVAHDEKQAVASKVEKKNLERSDFDKGIEIHQRPCLDGSSSDSDDGTTLNFARSRIGTINQRQLGAFLDEREQGNELTILEERQLAEGDDVFSREVPGDGGGGGDGSSGHSDSDVDGDGGVAIRVRSREARSRSRVRATATVQPITQSSENLPERERPVGDSVPASSQQWRNPADIRDSIEDNQFLSNLTPRSDVLPATIDADSSEESRLSARFFIASSTPGVMLRQNSTPQNNWMDENTTMFRFSEVSAPATPGIGSDTQDATSLLSDDPVFDSPRNKRDVVGDDSEGDKTITGAFPFSMESLETPTVDRESFPADTPTGTAATVAANNWEPSMEESLSSKNPFRKSMDTSMNPFSSFAYNKNPFDTMDMSENNRLAMSFSGFGVQNESEVGDSGFKINSQDAEALFDDDERSFLHSNTISKLANMSHESEWELDTVNEKGEVRLSKYFNAMSEDMGNFSLDRPDRPRPNFDDYKVVKTPPALEKPAVLYRPLPNDSITSIASVSKAQANARLDFSTDKNGSASSLASTYVLSKPAKEPSNLSKISFESQSKDDKVAEHVIHGQEGNINVPKTNDEAESLLHDIGVGRVSLRGISGVNISNLAEKIAIATNSDQQFIFKLLISLIEGEKRATRDADSTWKDKGRENIEAKSKKESSDYRPASGFGQNKSDVTVSHSQQKLKGKHALPTVVHAKSQDLEKQEQSSLKMSDLDDTLTMPSPNTSSLQSKARSKTPDSQIAPVRLRSAGDKVPNNVDRPNSKQILFQDPMQRSPKSSKGISKENLKLSDKLLGNARPISSVIPLIAPRENRALYRDSGVQCFTKQANDPMQSVERGASFERSAATAGSRNVTTVDAAVQWDGTETRQGFDISMDAVVSRQSMKKTTDTSAVQSSLRSTAARQLSSTTIEPGEPEEKLSKGLTLSPVVSEVESTALGMEDEQWKPLRLSKKLSNEMIAPDSADDAVTSSKKHMNDEFRKMSDEKIQEILPRISDIRVRESNATFYPLVATNQTVLGRPLDDKANATKEQKLQVQERFANNQPYTQLKPESASRGNKGEQKLHSSGGELRAKKSSLSSIKIVVPNELCFQNVQCVGVPINECLPVHNPSSRWIQCLIEVAFYSVNGSKADASDYCAFSLQPKVFIAPHTTEDVKVTFLAEHAGVYMAKLNLIASPVVTDDSILSEDELFPNDVHIEGIAEAPNIEMFQEDGGVIDFGEMPGGISRTRAIKLLNRGRADIPLKLVISGISSKFRSFAFVDSDMTPIGSSMPNQSAETEGLNAAVLNVILPGGKQMGKTFEPEVTWIQFKAPEYQDRGFPEKLGPRNEFSARVDIEIDSKGNGAVVGSLLLKAFVGIARLHAPRSLQAISISAQEGQRVSRGIPFRNAGNIFLEIHLQVSTFTDLFSVVPDKVLLAPGESTEVFVHFMSVNSITVESFLLVSVHPDGPQYEVVLRGTATAPKPVKEKNEPPVLLCSKPVLCWAGVPIGRSVQQRAYLRNNSLKQDLNMCISVEGGHSDFQVQNTFDFKKRAENSHEVTLKPQSEVPVHVLFVPSTFGIISSSLVIRPTGDGPKFMIPLHGYGGCSKLQLTNAQKVGDNYWIDAGEVYAGKQNIVNLSLQNVGNRAAFVKIVCYSDVSKRKLYPSSHISIAPNDFVLLEKCSKQLVIVIQATDSVLQTASVKPSAAAFLAVFSGDESLRQLYRKNKTSTSQKPIMREGPMQNLVFDAPFMDEDKVINEIKYPDIPNWESFFVSAISRTVVSLVLRPSATDMHSTQSSTAPLGLDPKDLIVNQTPARPLPKEAPRRGENGPKDLSLDPDSEMQKDIWAVSPEHIVLTAPNTVSDKSTARIQMINYSDKPLGFEFSWPAQSLIITPSKDNVPPRSQLIVFVSTKPSFLSTGGELPWRGCIYVQCEGTQKCIRVQIREDLALDSSPFTGVAKRLAPLNPSHTPLQNKQPVKLKSLVLVEPTSVVFPVTIVNRFQESFVKIESNSSLTMQWVLSSIAPPYFKDMSENGDIFRTTYTAFRFTKHSGTLQPKEITTIQVTFQPRDSGEYSQFWDLQVAVDATGETGKARIELRGKGVFSEANLSKEDGKLVGRAHPILKPPEDSDESSENSAKETSKSVEDGARSKAEKKNRGIFVKDDTLNFKMTSIGDTTEMQFKLCNDTKELQKVRFSGIKPPFSMKLNKLAIKPKSFIRIPVFYTPTEPNSRSEGHVEATCLSGPARTSYVKLIGTSQTKR